MKKQCIKKWAILETKLITHNFHKLSIHQQNIFKKLLLKHEESFLRNQTLISANMYLAIKTIAVTKVDLKYIQIVVGFFKYT